MSENLIIINKNTSFYGSIEAKQVIVEGNVEGDITASDKVLVKNGGMVNGTIDTDEILFEEGGKHEGLIILGGPLAEDENLENHSTQDEPAEQNNDDEFPYEERTEKKESPKRLW